MEKLGSISSEQSRQSIILANIEEQLRSAGPSFATPVPTSIATAATTTATDSNTADNITIAAPLYRRGRPRKGKERVKT